MIVPDWPLYARRGPEMARLMRWIICAAIVLAFAPGAFADDLDALRGSQTVGPATFTNWSGFYFGGELSYSGGNANFSGATQGPIAYALRNTELEEIFSPSTWPVLGSATATKTTYGAFAGYNTQWQDLVIGGELDYSTANMSFVAPSTPIYRQVSTVDPSTTEVTAYNVAATGDATLHIIDYGSLRARAGWIVDGNFLPYGFVGFAVGRGTYSTSSLVEWQQDTALPPAEPTLPCTVGTGTCADFAYPNSSSGSVTLMYGYNVGGGLDVALTSNIFVRGEFEYVHFFQLDGIVATIASGRVGMGLKF
jgi:outer membrane immunogenic protein